MATYKNMFFKEVCYSTPTENAFSTTDFNEIILETSSKILNTKKQIDEFMEIGGWKARRSGRELSIASSLCTDSFEKGVFRIKAQRKSSDWREWIKT